MKHSDTQKKKLSRAKIKVAKKNLRKLQRDGMSLRQIVSKLGNKITFQTLGRFIGEADYIPANPLVCELLDLYADQNPYRNLPKWYKRTPEALAFFNGKREQIKRMYNEAKEQARQR